VGLFIALIDIPIIWLLYFRLPFYLLYLIWNTLLYRLMRNRLGSPVALYRLSPQNWDELIWPPLPFLDRMLKLLAQENRDRGLAAIDAVASSFRQRWAAQRACERLLVAELTAPQTAVELAALNKQVGWLPAVGPRAFWDAFDGICVELNAALKASSDFNRLTGLSRAQGLARQLQASLPDWERKRRTRPESESADLTQLRAAVNAYLNEEELRELTFTLDIDYDGLSGAAKSGKARELIAAMRRDNRLDELRERLYQIRPQIAEFSGQHLQQSIAGLPFYSVDEMRPVLAHWIGIINDEITRVTRAEAASRGIPNPYIPGQPIQADGRTVFHGRQDIFAEIERSLTALHRPPTLVLHGPRRSGKTSLLNQLPDRLPENVAPVFVNLQEAVATAQSAAGFVVFLAQTIRKLCLAHRGLTLPPVNRVDFKEEPYLAFYEWLAAAERPLVGYTLFIAFDEFEWVETAIDQGRLNLAVLSFFRNLIQRGGDLRLALLFAGVRTLAEMKHNWPSYFINVKAVKVRYLPEDEARQLITNPITDFPLDYAPEALDTFIAQTRCQPYLIQLVAFELVNYLNSPERRAQGEWLTATQSDVETGFRRGLAAGYNYFAELWGSCNPAQQIILADLAAGGGLPPDLSDGQRALALRRLQRADLLEEVDGAYRIQIPLVARWIREEKPPQLARAAQ
ncbi:MAG: ATP-binding protein, partial [Chloroflexi bacterium]|nr:ATP-binding protein [Chloroflexota bacterium]